MESSFAAGGCHPARHDPAFAKFRMRSTTKWRARSNANSIWPKPGTHWRTARNEDCRSASPATIHGHDLQDLDDAACGCARRGGVCAGERSLRAARARRSKKSRKIREAKVLSGAGNVNGKSARVTLVSAGGRPLSNADQHGTAQGGARGRRRCGRRRASDRSLFANLAGSSRSPRRLETAS